MGQCETHIIILLNLLLIGIGLTALVIQCRKNKRDKRLQAPILTPYGFNGKFGGFNFVLKNDGPNRVNEIEEPTYNKEIVGEYDIRGQYLTQEAKGEFEFSKSTLAPQERLMVIFRKRSDQRPYNYKGNLKVLISYKGDLYKQKPLTLIFEVDTHTRTIKPVSFK